MSRGNSSLLRSIKTLNINGRGSFTASRFYFRQINVTAHHESQFQSYRYFSFTPRPCERTLSKSLGATATSNPAKIYCATPANLSVEQYHSLADSYLSELEEKFQELQEINEKIDVEFSAGVLTLTLPPKGIYVINKQPPNKQIWLASPVSGPKRYDYVMLSEEQDTKHATGRGEWVYLRDGSTLSSLLKEECQVVMTGEFNK